jgi:hypothetical protein
MYFMIFENMIVHVIVADLEISKKGRPYPEIMVCKFRVKGKGLGLSPVNPPLSTQDEIGLIVSQKHHAIPV